MQLRGKIRGLHGRIADLEAKQYDLEEKAKKQAYDVSLFYNFTAFRCVSKVDGLLRS